MQGYYGALGQGDFDARARLTPVPGLEGVAGGIRDAACGWAHAAVATGEGRLWLFGRPHDVRKALSLRHMWQTLPWLVRANQVGAHRCVCLCGGGWRVHAIYQPDRRRRRLTPSSPPSHEPQAMKRVLDSPKPSSGEQYYREDVLLRPREFPLPEGERAASVACSGALTAVVTGG